MKIIFDNEEQKEKFFEMISADGSFPPKCKDCWKKALGIEREEENRTVVSSMNEFLILSKEDIKKILDNKTVVFEVEKFIPEIMVCTEEHYDQLMSEVKEAAE